MRACNCGSAGSIPALTKIYIDKACTHAGCGMAMFVGPSLVLVSMALRKILVVFYLLSYYRLTFDLSHV